MVTFMAPALAFLGGPKFMSWFATEPEPGLQGRSMALPRGKGTGGSTNVNGQIFIRGQREDFDGWRDRGNPGWGFDDLLPYFRKLERFELLADPVSGRHIAFGKRPLAEQIDPAFMARMGRSTSRRCAASTRWRKPIWRRRRLAGYLAQSRLQRAEAERRRALQFHAEERAARHRRGRLYRSGARSPKPHCHSRTPDHEGGVRRQDGDRRRLETRRRDRHDRRHGKSSFRPARSCRRNC